MRISALDKVYSSLLYGNGLRQIPGLIYIASAAYGNIICKELIASEFAKYLFVSGI